MSYRNTHIQYNWKEMGIIQGIDSESGTKTLIMYNKYHEKVIDHVRPVFVAKYNTTFREFITNWIDNQYNFEKGYFAEMQKIGCNYWIVDVVKLGHGSPTSNRYPAHVYKYNKQKTPIWVYDYFIDNDDFNANVGIQWFFEKTGN